jgi:rhodanese-related sulfurtransferase
MQRAGAVLVDIRPAAQRETYGMIPETMAIERNVLEWRFDPRSDARLPVADRYDLPVVVLCQEGYTSSLAAASLRDLGLHRAIDIVGGFAAWAAAGLPTVAA